jgi:uncharacterized protein YhfF
MDKPLPVPDAVLPFWNQFQAAAGADPASRFYEAFHFDDNQASADELAQLVLQGTKRATAGLLWSFETDQKRPPRPGDLSVVTNWAGEPLCIIETAAVSVVPYDEVSEDFAATEGEGDGSLRHWREVHWAYFGRECSRIGKTVSLKMPVVCERFTVVYPRR